MQFSVAVICLKLILTHSLVFNLIGSNLDIKEPKGKKKSIKSVPQNTNTTFLFFKQEMKKKKTNHVKYFFLLLLWSVVRLCMQHTWRAYQLHQAPFLSLCQKTQDSRFYRPFGYRMIASLCLGLRGEKPRPEEPDNRKERSNSDTCLDPYYMLSLDQRVKLQRKSEF